MEFDCSLFTGCDASPTFALLRKLNFHIGRKDSVEAPDWLCRKEYHNGAAT